MAAPVAEERWDVEAPAEPPAPPADAGRAGGAAGRRGGRAAGARADDPETSAAAEPGLPWTRERLHDAAKRAGLVKLAGQVYEAIRGDRLAADLTEADWAAMARELGLEP